MAQITLQMLLESRENRAAFQKVLLDGYNLPLVSFTVNTPGAVKLTPDSEYVFSEGVREIRERLAGRVMYSKLRVLETGCEGFFVVEMDADELKRTAVQIEQTHALGRLFDIDVLAPDGAHISRQSLGLPERSCLLCGGIAAACVRAGSHNLEDLMENISGIIGKYREGESAKRV